MSKQFLAVGDYLINPELLTYAILERGASEPHLRLGFATRGAEPDGELQLTGDAAREVLRWLRLNAVFLSTGGAFGAAGVAAQSSHETDSRSNGWRENGPIGEGWGPRRVPQQEESGRHFVEKTFLPASV
jgi:hypothetical protein